MDNFTFEFFREKLEKIGKKLEEIQKEIKTMAQNQDDLKAAITAVAEKVGAVSDQIADLSTDIDAAVAKLQADIANGVDTTESVTALSDLATKLGAASDALAAVDSKMETISGQPTPPPAA